jgi:hypothetical protein
MLIGALLTAGGCAAGAMEYSSAYYSWSRNRVIGDSFGWVTHLYHSSEDPRAANPELHEIVRTSIKAQLAARGYEERAEEPAFLIDYYVAPMVGRKKHSDVVTDYDEGSLTVYVVDPESRRAMWRGTARARIDDPGKTEVNRRKVEKAVRGIVERMPAR